MPIAKAGSMGGAARSEPGLGVNKKERLILALALTALLQSAQGCSKSITSTPVETAPLVCPTIQAPFLYLSIICLETKPSSRRARSRWQSVCAILPSKRRGNTLMPLPLRKHNPLPLWFI